MHAHAANSYSVIWIQHSSTGVKPPAILTAIPNKKLNKSLHYLVTSIHTFVDTLLHIHNHSQSSIASMFTCWPISVSLFRTQVIHPHSNTVATVTTNSTISNMASGPGPPVCWTWPQSPTDNQGNGWVK